MLRYLRVAQVAIASQSASFRSCCGTEFVSQTVQDWIKVVGARTAYIEPGSPWENGHCDSFNARFLDEFLNGEIFYNLRKSANLNQRMEET